MNAKFIDERHTFHGTGPSESICRIRILFGTDSALIVCSELPENGGTCITNKATAIAKEISQKHHIDPDKFIWIEHFSEPDEYASVSFCWNGHKFTQPVWEVIATDDFKNLLRKYVEESASPEALETFL